MAFFTNPRGIAGALALVLFGCGGGGGGSVAQAAPVPSGSAGSGSTSGGSSGGGGGSSSSGGGQQAAATSFDAFEALLAGLHGLSSAQQQQRLDAFVALQRQRAEGFPLRRGADVRFVYRGQGSGPFAVAGSWNAWSTSALPLARIGSTNLWTAAARLPASTRHEYKIVEGSGAAWRSDPLNRKFTFGYQNSVVNLAGSGKSHLELWPDVPASTLGNTRDVIAYLPAGALDDGERYPVVYLHDGQNLFDPDAFFGGWGVSETLDAEISAGRIRKVIAIGIANTPARMDEYTHVPDDISSRCNGSVMGGLADAYLEFIVDELKPAVDALYPTRPERASTAILGSSLGGLVSLYAAYRHPDVFKNVGGMSSTLGWGDFCLGNPRVVDIARSAGRLDIRFYLDSGGTGASSPGGDNWGVTEELKLLLEQQGYRHGVDLSHWWEPGAPHNEAAWRARFAKPLRFWFPR